MVQTTGQITGLSANSTCAFSMHGDNKARKCQRDWMSPIKLKQDSKRQAFINDICSRLDAMELRSDDPEENWTVFRDIVHSSAMDFLGPVSYKHQDWFDENDEEIQDSLKRNTKNTMHTLVIPAQYPIRRHIQIYARQSRLGSEICKTPG